MFNRLNVSGPLCNMCARGYTGQWPQCETCGECFQNWDEIIQNLRNQVEVLIGKFFIRYFDALTDIKYFVIVNNSENFALSMNLWLL